MKKALVLAVVTTCAVTPTITSVSQLTQPFPPLLQQPHRRPPATPAMRQSAQRRTSSIMSSWSRPTKAFAPTSTFAGRDSVLP